MTYRCLSYGWGEFSADLPIKINGARFFVRRQLHDFLKLQQSRRAAISLTPNEPLWIDALCSDQTNMVERDHQAPKMGQIFSKACEVLIWLGVTPMLSSFGAGYVERFEIDTVISQLCNERGEASPWSAYTWLARQNTTSIYALLETGDNVLLSK